MSLSRPLTLTRVALLTPLAVALLGLSGGARAQSLQVLYDTARDYDSAYLSAKAAAEAARYRADQAGALNLPTVGLQASTALSKTDGSGSTTVQGTTTTAQVDGNTRNTQIGVSAQQTLFNRANGATVAQAERAVQLAVVQLKAVEQDLIVRLTQGYFDVLAATDALATVQASKKAISEQLASAKRNFEVGTATITDTREAQARYDLATAQELAATNDLQVKHLALDQLVGKANLQPRPLAQPVALPPLQPALVDDWVSGADAVNPNVLQAQLAVDVAKLETEKARAGNLPTVTLGASYGRSYPGGSTTTHLPAYDSVSRSGNGSSAGVNLTLNMPLFAGFAIQNRVKETLSLEEKARIDLLTARRAVTQGTRSAYYGVQSGRAQVKALEAAESSSKLALEATQLGYKVGVRVNLDVLNAQTQLFQTQASLAKARYDVIVGDMKLRQASGQLKPEDVAAVNALLVK
ncbi:MAG: TolC family outer membrane protein [Burkholderiales bacterium]|nr:TolC family outer membrane protein [Burkholderiales bacterium]